MSMTMPLRHRASGIGGRDSLECLPCLWIRHVMQERDCAIELLLGLPGAGNKNVDRAQGVSVLLDRVSRFARAASEQEEDHQACSAVQEDLLPTFHFRHAAMAACTR